jgi:membrane dipeptidase
VLHGDQRRKRHGNRGGGDDRGQHLSRQHGGRDRGAAAARKADLDGMDYGRKIFDLTEGLVRRGYTREQIQLILGGNFRRVLDDIWQPTAITTG